jgi:hypothetical protein
VLTVGCLATLWFFTEVWDRYADDILTRIGRSATMIGLGGVAAGGLILIAPAGVQLNTDRDYPGIEIANTFAQAGFAVMLILGIFALALAVCLASVQAWRTGAAPRWFAVAGLVAAVIMLGSYIWIPGFIFPVWILATGVVGLHHQSASSQATPTRVRNRETAPVS